LEVYVFWLSCRVTTLLPALFGSLLLAAIATLGDFVWARFHIEHKPLFGLLHGGGLCLAIGLYLGALRGQAIRGAAAGVLIGFTAAASFYLLSMFMGYAAMFPCWMGLWAGFGLLHGRGLGEPRSSVSAAIVRGAIAAVGSGLAFYAISGIWTERRPGGPDYAHNFLSWTIAFLPGFLALLVGGSATSSSPPSPRTGPPWDRGR